MGLGDPNEVLSNLGSSVTELTSEVSSASAGPGASVTPASEPPSSVASEAGQPD